MQLQKNMWIEGSYYVDFDKLGQLRIVGPNNHLHYGSVDLYRDQIEIDSTYNDKNQFIIVGRLLGDHIFLHDPAIGHIKRVRDLTELPGKPVPTFKSIYSRYPTDLAPNYIGLELTDDGYEISYKRLFQDHWYGAKLTLEPGTTVRRHERRRGYVITTAKPFIKFKLATETDSLPQSHLSNIVLGQPYKTEVFGAKKTEVERLLDRTAFEVTHLVKNNKTSGFDYGTVFPRDWMESADLGVDDLSPEAISYMYKKAYEFINPQGLGWHENIVGEFEYEKEQEARGLSQSLDDLIDQSNRVSRSLRELVSQITEMYITRNMVDIEPRYLFALESVPKGEMSEHDLDRAKKVARFIILQASNSRIITFKKIPRLMRRHKYDEYYSAGNWRDSESAFLKVHAVLAPYDVNVVFYPKALEIIHKNAKLLGIDKPKAAELVAKWSEVRDLYRFQNRDGSTAYALALYNIKENKDGSLHHDQLKVNHLDEAYDLFYNHPSREEVLSFANRLMSKDYFYTKSGPTIVGAKDGYTTTQYHGRVIWTKQTAFAVAGLQRQLQIAKQAGWSAAQQRTIEQALLQTASASIEAWLKLGSVPELHYDKSGRPHYYNDQPATEGPMNLVQLWSAVGARRIIKAYTEIVSG